MLFVGRDIGLVGPANLIKHITKLGVRSVVKLATPEETDADIASKLYDDVIGRTLIASELLSDLKRVIKLPGEAASAAVRADTEPVFKPDDTHSQRLRQDAFRDQRRESGDQVQEVHTRT